MTDWSQESYNIFNDPEFKSAYQNASYEKVRFNYNVDTGNNETITTTFKFKAVFTSFRGLQAPQDQPIVDNLTYNDVTCLFPFKGTKFVPTMGDNVVWNGITYSIINTHVDPTTTAFYKLQLRSK